MKRRQLNNGNFEKIFRDSLLPWLRQGVFTTALAEPPFNLPTNVPIISASRSPLKIKRGRRTAGNLTQWPRLGLHGKPNPFFAFVLEGYADLSVGVTERMVANSGVRENHGFYQLRLPPQSALIYPANVPTTDGVKPHWEDPSSLSLPNSAILWVDIMAEGAILHTCQTRNRLHTSGPTAFVFDTHLLSLTHLLIEELRNQDDAEELTQSLLQVLLLRIERSLARNAYSVTADMLLHTVEQKASALHAGDVKRACDFIEGQLGHRLTVDKIAEQVFVSPAQLNRLFRAELGCSVMQYVNAKRLERAKYLLQNTSLPVGIISDNLGIRNVVYFCRMFREKTGMTPLQYRRHQH